jgi:hypothetical protein
MPRMSGKYGAINGLSTVRNWNAAITNTPFSYSASNTRAGTGRNRGIRDWTGSFQQLMHTPNVVPGEIFTFEGFLAPTTGDYGTAGPAKTGSAIVQSVVIVWAWDTNEPINCTVNFAGVTPLEDATATITDLTIPDMEIPEGKFLKYGAAADTFADIMAGTVGDDLINTSRATLTMTCTNPEFVDSNTAGWRGRVKGKMDWTLEIARNDVSLADRPFDIDDIISIVLPVSATEYWGIKFARVMNFSGVTVDINEGGILTETISMGMQATDVVEGMGEIVAPGSVTPFWPFVTG